ncbi:hypothetical protein GCM10022220_53980 [Actinocatenispora rupis]|uniref:Uncharacterized protein n=2 Tax=Actinocatenispora rupis TaxID=519421 RepID=A0A8J3ISV6_9ACTN|nr:hypothetical protein Aru02nite_01700 [Actinocatenispora rupis]
MSTLARSGRTVTPMDLPRLGADVDPGWASRLVDRLSGGLYPGERVLAMVGARRLRPMILFVAVTTGRILALDANPQVGPQIAVTLAGTRVELSRRRPGSNRLRATPPGASAVDLGTVGDPDARLLREVLPGPDVPPLPPGAPAVWRRSVALRAGRRRRWPGTTFVGGRLDDMTVRAILCQCRPGEYPWLVLGSTAVLVAFADRLAIVKPELAGDHPALGSVVDYTDVTDLEYLSDGRAGALVVHSTRFAPYDVDRARADGVRGPRQVPNALPLDRDTYLAAQEPLARLHTLVTAGA